MRFLVTGGAGFIASHIVDRLIKEGHHVAIVDNLSSGKESNINPKAKLYKIDICDPGLETVFEVEKPDYVSHHAAQISVVISVRDPQLDAQINVIGALNVLQQCIKYNVKKLIFASTGGTVYGEPEYLPADEKHPTKPLCPYAINKLTFENYLYMYGVVYGLNYSVLRYANVYGPRQDPHGEAGVIAIFTQKIIDGVQPIIFGDGKATRDYIFIDDVVDANMIALEKGDREIYNIGTAIETDVNEIFRLLKKEFGFSKDAINGEKRPGELQRISIANDKAKAELGWYPKYTLEQGIKKTAEYYKL
ncbi:TPA: NAD-dependent epimerase/dehydratase family protein [bacterium]|nr:NAD-dependent epimerase/dehydratase family protein [bacterium]